MPPKAPRRERLGQVLLSQGFITDVQLDEALEEQRKKPYLHVGEILFHKGFLTFFQLEEVLEQQFTDMRLGQMLLRKRKITHEQLEQALTEHEDTGLLLGHLIIKNGYCSMEEVQKVLEAQREEIDRMYRSRPGTDD